MYNELQNKIAENRAQFGPTAVELRMVRQENRIGLNLNRSLNLNLFRACSGGIKIKSKIKNPSAGLISTAVQSGPPRERAGVEGGS